MRVAVQISGFLRGFHQCLPFWSNFLDSSCSYDFFVSTYDVYGYNNKTMWDFDHEDKVDLDRVANELREYGSLIDIQTRMPSDEPRYKQMFDRVSEAHQSCKDHFTDYSYIIRLRPDIFTPKKVTLVVPENNEAIFPERWGFCEETTEESCRWTGGFGLCDQMSVCGQDAMQTYADICNLDSHSQSPEASILNAFTGKQWSHQDFHQCVLSRNKK